MKLLGLILIGLITLVTAVPLRVIDCEEQYNQCVTQCCSSCGSTIGYDTRGDMVCNAGTSANPKQECITACTPCSTNYHQCTSSTSNGSSDTTSCCGSAIVLGGVLGLAFLKQQGNL